MYTDIYVADCEIKVPLGTITLSSYLTAGVRLSSPGCGGHIAQQMCCQLQSPGGVVSVRGASHCYRDTGILQVNNMMHVWSVVVFLDQQLFIKSPPGLEVVRFLHHHM